MTSGKKRTRKKSKVSHDKNVQENSSEIYSDNEHWIDDEPSTSQRQMDKSENLQQQVTSTYKEYVPDDNHLLEMRTLAGNTFKNLLDTLKAVLNEANIIFTEKGLKLAAVDTNKHALVHLFMEASSFEFYHCKQEKLVLGVDIESLHRTIKSNKSNDLMCFIVRKDNPGFLEVSFENLHKGTTVCDTIQLLSLKEYSIFDKITYNLPPQMDSPIFHNICKEMVSFQATKLEIKRIGDELIFSNLDGTTRRRVVVKVGEEYANENDTNASGQQWTQGAKSEPTKNHGEEARGVFLLRFLKSFAKAATLSPKVRIYLKNDFTLICEYSVAGLGTLRYVLSSEE